MNAAMNSTTDKQRNLAGPITIGVMFAFALAVFGGFWFAKRASNPAPAQAKFGVPQRAIRVVSVDVKDAQLDQCIATINAIQPDIVLMQSVPTSEVGRVGEALHMSRASEPDGDVFYPAQNFDGPATPFGNAIYSRFPLFEGRSIPNRGGSFGVWAVVVVDEAKLMVASIRATDSTSHVLGTQDANSLRDTELAMLVRAHRQLGGPPIIIGGLIEMGATNETLTAHVGAPIAHHGGQQVSASGNAEAWNVVNARELAGGVSGVFVELAPRR
jgi:hypothetical protein